MKALGVPGQACLTWKLERGNVGTETSARQMVVDPHSTRPGVAPPIASAITIRSSPPFLTIDKYLSSCFFAPRDKFSHDEASSTSRACKWGHP